MTDTLTPRQRSGLMSRVRQKDTAPELVVRRLLHAQGLRYKLHPSSLPGRPDIVFPRFRVAVFVHGCFWHGHACRGGRAPSSNTDYWSRKIAENRSRDERKTQELERLGWRVMTVWECETKTGDLREKSIRWAKLVRSELGD